MKIKDLVLIGMLGALLLTVQVSLAFLPNVELVTLLIIIYTLVLHKKTIYIIGVFILLEGLIYGLSLWWINYLYVWYVLYFVVTLFKKEQSHIFWAIIAGAYGFGFGALCSIPYFFMGLSSKYSVRGGLQSAFAYWITGIPFDLIHGTANFIVILVLFIPLTKVFRLLVSMDARTVRNE